MRPANSHSPHRVSLNLQSLDDRVVPALVGYSTGTLTLTAATGDALSAALNSTTIPGYLEIKNGVTVIFDCSVLNKPVKNLIVKAGKAANYTLDLTDVSLTNLSVGGASTTTAVTLGVNTVVNGNFTFAGNPLASAADTIKIPSSARVGGNVTLALKGGANTVNLAGTIGGNATVTASGGADTINIADTGALGVGGTLSLQLGGGVNKVNGVTNAVTIGKDLSYVGGLNDDNIDVSLAPLRVGRNVKLSYSSALISNTWTSGPLFVGGNFVATGGIGSDNLNFNGASEVGGNVTMNLGAGGNFFAIGYNFTFASVVGGSISYTGAAGIDGLYLDHIVVGKNVTASFGSGFSQSLYFGTRQAAKVQIGGAVKLTGGTGAEYANIFFAKIGGALILNTLGGSDKIQIDDTDVNGPVLVDLGDGDDEFLVDTQAFNGSGTALSGVVRFESTLTLAGGAGADTVNLSDATGNKVLIGGNIKLTGGADADTFVHFITGNVYLGTIKFEDFELGESF